MSSMLPSVQWLQCSLFLKPSYSILGSPTYVPLRWQSEILLWFMFRCLCYVILGLSHVYPAWYSELGHTLLRLQDYAHIPGSQEPLSPGLW